MVRAKFRCDSVEHAEDSATVKLAPVTGDSPENTQFFRWTPWGQIVLNTVNPEAAARFEPGKEYYVDFTPAA